MIRSTHLLVLIIHTLCMLLPLRDSIWSVSKMVLNFKDIESDSNFPMQFMGSSNLTKLIDELTSQVKRKFIPMSRIDDAVKRILRVKFTMGLFENPIADHSLAKKLGSKEHRELAREAVRKSLVLLKNGENADKPLLPLPKKANKILVAGTHADNLGYQCGGWTITWQGLNGNNLTIGTHTFPHSIPMNHHHIEEH